MKRGNITLASVVAVGLWLAGSAALTPIELACAAQAQVSYSEDIAPVFRGWCASCHAPGGEGEKASGLDLSTYEGLMKGTKFGPMVVPESPTRATSWCSSTARPRSACRFGTSRCQTVFARTSGRGFSRARRTTDGDRCERSAKRCRTPRTAPRPDREIRAPH